MNRLSAGGDIEGNKQENFSDMSSDLRVLEALLLRRQSRLRRNHCKSAYNQEPILRASQSTY